MPMLSRRKKPGTTWRARTGATGRCRSPSTCLPARRKISGSSGGRLIGGRDNIGQDTSKESREMANIDSRLRHVDEIGTGVQVLYPTLFLRPVTDNPRIELVLCRSYNRWMADIWSKA